MDNQTAFNLMVRHLRQQGEKAVNESGRCMYRGPRGLKCAVGALIPEALYAKRFEKKRIGSLLDPLDKTVYSEALAHHFRGVDPKLLMHMQAIHDIHLPAQWEDRFKQIANNYGLVLESPELTQVLQRMMAPQEVPELA